MYNNFLQWHDIWPWWWSWLDDLLKLPVSQLVLVDSGHPVVGESHLNLLLVLIVLLNSSKLQNCGSAKLCPVPFWVVRVTGTVTRVSKSQGLMKSIGPLISPQIAAPWFNQHLMTHLGHQRIFLGIHDSLGFMYPGLRIPLDANHTTFFPADLTIAHMIPSFEKLFIPSSEFFYLWPKKHDFPFTSTIILPSGNLTIAMQHVPFSSLMYLLNMVIFQLANC